MKYSYNWIRELSGTTKNVHEIAQLLLTHSFEIESIEDLSTGLDKVVIGEVLTKEKHPNADRLNVATVNVGAETLQIVCGAPNLAVGQKVPVAMVGAELPCGITIKKSKIRDVESNGMICAEDELGLSKNHDTIIVLDDDAPIGASFALFVGRDDAVMDIKILPNRGHDCLSHVGIANEIRALEGRHAQIMRDCITEVSESYDAEIATPQCKRYIACELTGVQMVHTPDWMVARLRACEIKPINLIVDITNYVMLETGQPLHAFDGDVITKILVRQAQDGEKLTLLDDTELSVTRDDMVITDGIQPIALAGVMGGKMSGISEHTTHVVLESASFDAPTIRYTQRRFNHLTDAAFRFERDLDPHVAMHAAKRAIDLFVELCGAQVVKVSDIFPEPVQQWRVLLPIQSVSKLLGTEVPQDTIIDILERLGMQVTIIAEKNVLDVIVPTIRRDLTTQEDLIEEVGRIYGYDKIVKKPLQENLSTPKENEARTCERMISDLCVAHGFDEVKGYSFYAVEDAQAVGLDDDKHVAVLNPLTPEHGIMRRSLVPELCRFVKKNLSYISTVRIFDIGRVYDPVDTSLPDEKLIVGIAVASRAINGTQFYEIKGLVETLCERLNVGRIYFDDVFDVNVEHVPDLHPSRRAMVRTESGVVLGWIGEASKKAHKYYGIKKDRVSVCELYVTELLAQQQSENFFVPLAKYPTVTRDLSMIVPERMRVADIERMIYATGGTFLQDVDLFDEYNNAETGERSLAFHMLFGSDDRTLSSEEIDAQIAVIIADLEKEQNIDVRT